MAKIYYETELYHHGIKGMKWGVRRYQNPNGSLTALGRQRLVKKRDKYTVKAEKATNPSKNAKYNKKAEEASEKIYKSDKMHQDAAVKGLKDSVEQYGKAAKTYKSYVDINKKALDKVEAAGPPKTNSDAWTKQALTDAYKAAGRAYVNAKFNEAVFTSYLKAYSDSTIRVGRDYVVDNFDTGNVALTDSGRAKEQAILDLEKPKLEKKYAKEIKRFS